MQNEIVYLNQAIEQKKVNDVVAEQLQKKLDKYAGDYRRFTAYCQAKGLTISFESLESYLLYTIDSRLKLSTFNRRLAAIKYYLSNVEGLEMTVANKQRIALLRQSYDDDENAELKRIEGQTAQPQREVIDMIHKLDTRAKAIALLNLITACRPSEMVRVKVGHLDLVNRSAQVYMKKTKTWHTKRLTLECVTAIKQYVKAYRLGADSFLVGSTDKWGHYTSQQISEDAYRKTIHKWLGFAPYTLRKTQVTAMHEAGADLAQIAKQSGHKSLETISRHYLEVRDTSIDKFL